MPRIPAEIDELTYIVSYIILFDHIRIKLYSWIFMDPNNQLEDQDIFGNIFSGPPFCFVSNCNSRVSVTSRSFPTIEVAL